MIIKPHIKLPCHEDWNAMKIGIHSRHCFNCKKDVVDFTGMSRGEILTYLFSNYNKEICGRAYSHQLDFTHQDLLITVQALSKNPKNTNFAFFLLTIGTLILTSCHSEGKKEEHKSEWSVDLDDKDEVEEKKKLEGVEVDLTHSEVMGIMMVDVQPDTVGTIAHPFYHEGTITPVDEEIQPVYAIVDEMPEFRGGMGALMSFIKRNMKYPEYEKHKKIEGIIYASFMIDETGKIDDLSIIDGKSDWNENFRLEVIRVLSGMPRWKPGKLRGKKVKVQYSLPVKFEL